MRKTTSILVLLPLACALFSKTGFSQTELVVSTSGGRPVPVYENNAITSSVIANLSNGEVVNALETRFGWTMIRTADDKLGYIGIHSLGFKGYNTSSPCCYRSPNSAIDRRTGIINPIPSFTGDNTLSGIDEADQRSKEALSRWGSFLHRRDG